MEPIQFPDLEAQWRQANTGNPTIDNLALVKAYQDVWYLLNRFPLVKAWQLTLGDARRNGRIKFLVESDPAYAALRGKLFPKTYQEWELLAMATIEACTGIRPTSAQLLNYDAIRWGDSLPGSIGYQCRQQQMQWWQRR